ncbi:hypothetical protein FFWV33_10840 [Flavobacterium faecale]|uniref:histidine kinase n=1 Tax=Flavobacterium faecale TaxID=1355330 RepID=A0A2S1LE04_9FLAO|nr:hypothetical protein [Flavobacterium faecale]AWG21980.1 hypothetical protein FFWV33_10840 [Flavobacterium faecale]
MIAPKYHTYLLLLIAVSLQYCDQKKPHFEKAKIDRKTTDSLINRADSYFAKIDYDQAIEYYYKGKIAAETKKDTSRMFYSLLSIAIIQYYQTDFSNAEKSCIDGLELLNNDIHDPRNYDIYINLGNIYTLQKQFHKALSCFQKASTFRRKNSKDFLNIENNIAWVYLETKDFSTAIQKLEILNKNLSLESNNYLKSIVLMNLGHCYSSVGDRKGIAFLHKARRITPKNENSIVTANNLYLSQHYSKTDIDSSNYYALQAYQCASRIKATDERLLSLYSLIQNSKPDASKQYAILYLKINDSITKVRNNSKNLFAKLKYDFSTFEKENSLLKTEKILLNEQQKNKNSIAGLITIIGILLTTLIIRNLLSKNKQEKIRATIETESRISKQIHDELANDLYQTIAYGEINDLSETENKQTILEKLNKIYNRIRDFSIQTKPIEVGTRYEKDLRIMMTDYSNLDTNIIVNGLDQIDWSKITSQSKVDLYRIVQELLVNMKKHSNCSVVLFRFKKNESSLHLSYSDNGKGNNSPTLEFGAGLTNIQERIHHSNGTITFETDTSGFKVSIEIPT